MSSSVATTSTSTSGIPHHRHPSHHHEDGEGQDVLISTEASPLFAKIKTHLSFMTDDDDVYQRRRKDLKSKFLKYLTEPKKSWIILLGFILLLLTLIMGYFEDFPTSLRFQGSSSSSSSRGIPVEDAIEHYIPIPSTSTNHMKLWFRTWGKAVEHGGIPVVFFHGGPGNAIADYFGNSNKRFFDKDRFFVVEVDQRGTGKSQPSVRDSWKNMKYYADISIDQICDDFEIIRKYLNIDRWIVWGGSFGSTLAINYGERYPKSTLALFLRGIYLDTKEEVSAVYAQHSYLNNPKRLKEFNILYDYAAQYVKDKENKNGDEPLLLLDPNDAERLMRIYAEMITNGDHSAIWHWFVFENNLMEIDPKYLLDPNNIDEQYLPEALSVAFFETRLWIHGSYELPTSDLLSIQNLNQLTMPMWICQGQHDEVCPSKYAKHFVSEVENVDRSPRIVSRFLNATHEDTDPELEDCLKRSLEEFVDIYY